MFHKEDGNSEIYSRKDETSVPLIYHGLVVILGTDYFHVAELATEDSLVIIFI
jgi:hypothetical protein